MSPRRNRPRRMSPPLRRRNGTEWNGIYGTPSTTHPNWPPSCDGATLMCVMVARHMMCTVESVLHSHSTHILYSVPWNTFCVPLDTVRLTRGLRATPYTLVLAFYAVWLCSLVSVTVYHPSNGHLPLLPKSRSGVPVEFWNCGTEYMERPRPRTQIGLQLRWCDTDVCHGG